MIRQPIIAVLGHVDHGKTTLLDKIRGTSIAKQEAGAITQHIGATEVPIEVVKDIAENLIAEYGFQLKIPGLLFMDTPGHEAFTSLRERGGSIADIAILVIDITQQIQPQTVEAINILKAFKTPFVVAANKIDLIQGWNSVEGSFQTNLSNQSEEAKTALDEKIYSLVGGLFEHGFKSERFDRCKDFTKEIPIVPVSALTGEGIPELLVLIAGLSQKFLGKRLELSGKEKAKGTVLEVKEETGLGKTIDVILFEGCLHVRDEIITASIEGTIRTKIRALLKPKPLEEIRDPKKKFSHVNSVCAASGVKVVAPNLDNVLAGAPLLSADIENAEEEIKAAIAKIRIESASIGPIVKADALGSLEAFIKMLESKGIKVRKADIGNVSKRDIMDAIAVKKKDKFLGVIFAFNVDIDEIALQTAKEEDIKIFKGNVIYKLIEEFEEWQQKQKELERIEKLNKLVWPAKARVLKGFIFRNSKPAIVGVRIECGKLKSKSKVFKEGKSLGRVVDIQSEGKSLKEAKKGEEVALSIDKAVVGRNLFEEDIIYTDVPDEHGEELKKENALTTEEEELLEEIKELRRKIKKEGEE
ncbi:MAG: translation initiation factor IF-2 [Candidatus Diapherotrites archaeon]|nr:translation initiation factor IF-2 [Candidatus Diapherotrites archaeon]